LTVHVEMRREMVIENCLNDVEAIVLATVRGHGFAVSEPQAGRIAISRGSMLRTRLVGAWWCKPATLPVRGVISCQPGINGSCSVEVMLSDDTRWLYFDRRVRNRYDETLTAIADLIFEPL
jgi:hypothetical protein